MLKEAEEEVARKIKVSTGSLTESILSSDLGLRTQIDPLMKGITNDTL